MASQDMASQEMASQEGLEETKEEERLLWCPIGSVEVNEGSKRRR